MNIAIIGAGFSGMAVAWHLLHRDGVQVTIFDAKGIGGAASGIAAGLLHPYAGLHCKLNWKGREGMQASLKLLKTCQESVYANTGLMRFALNETAVRDYALCAQRYPEEVIWLDSHEAHALVPQAVPHPAVFIRPALIVYSEYIQGLWEICSKKGALLKIATISSLEELHSFDGIVVANGAMAGQIRELADLPITLVKGQILELSWPEHLPPLPMPLNSQVYIIMNPNHKSCLIGATYERNFMTDKPEEDIAARDLLPKAVEMIPALKGAKIMGCRSALRASAPHHRPYMEQFDHRCWILTGMGSKGLLYHALFAEQLVNEIFREGHS